VPYYSRQIVKNRLELRASQLQEAAEILPQGDEREALLNRARRMENASLVIDRWATSPGLRGPR
jgi:hypothetical protein